MKKLLEIVLSDIEDCRNSEKTNLLLEKVCQKEDNFMKLLSKEQIQLYRELEDAKNELHLNELENTILQTIKTIKEIIRELY